MAVHMNDVKNVSAVGVYDPATLTKWPEFGGTASVVLIGGTSPSATVQLRAWNDSNAKEILATFTLPVPPGNPKAGDIFDSLPVASQWEDFDWNVTAIAGSPTLRMTFSGVGL